MKKIFLILFIVILLTTSAVAIERVGPFKAGSDVSLVQVGSNFTFCNITSVRYPGNNSIAVDNVKMTKVGNEFNYTLSGQYTQVLGDYIVNGFCSNGTTDVVWAYYANVNPTGEIQSSILDNAVTWVLLILFMLLFFIALKIEVAWLGAISSLPLLTLGVYTMIYGFNSVTNIYTRGAAFVILGFGLIIMFYSIYEWLFESEGGNF